MTFSIEQIYEIFLQYRYFIIFPIIVIEGPIASVIAGFLVAQEILNFYLIYFIILTGDLAGDIAYYALGRWGRNGMISKWGKYLGISEEKVTNLDQHFKNHSGKTILLGKLSHGIGTIFIVAAGMAKMPFRNFLYWSTLGTIPKSLLLLLIGYFFGSALARINTYFDYVAIGSFGLAGLLVLGYYLFIKFIRKKEKEL